MSKIYCSTCKYYDYNTREGVDWCKLNDEETGICGHCERDFEDLDEATEHYDAVVEENNKLYSLNCEMAGKVADLEHRLSNCIEPKFKVGQEVWETTPLMSWKIKRIEWHKFNGGNGDVVVEIYRLGHDGTDDYNCCIMPVDNDRFFATEEEAKAKLRSLKDGCDRT